MLNGMSNVFSEEVGSIRQYVGETRMKYMPCEVMGENKAALSGIRGGGRIKRRFVLAPGAG